MKHCHCLLARYKFFVELFLLFLVFFAIQAQSSFSPHNSPFFNYQPIELDWHGHENMYKSRTNQSINQQSGVTASKRQTGGPRREFYKSLCLGADP